MKIAIAGFGVEGQASYDYWSQDPMHQLTIVDQNEVIQVPDGVATLTGPTAFEELKGFDMVVRSAGLAPYKIKTDGKIWSATNEFFEKCSAPIIGVTGTKGKGTTSSMIASIFEAAGYKVWLVGNIGKASLEVLAEVKPSDIVVYELSSFQLWDIERSPQTAVVLGIEPEHLDVHRTMDDYVSAKGNIRRFQKEGDICVYNALNEYSQSIALLTKQGETYPYGLDETAGGHVHDGFFYVGEEKICVVETLQLKGDHNKENASAAITVAHSMGISNDAIATGLGNFKGLPHRLEFVRNYKDVDYYNDSFSSSTPATVAAVRSFTQPEIVIVGGIDRGGDFEHLAEALREQKNIKHILLIGDIRHKLAEIFKTAGLPIVISDAQTMGEIVHEAADIAESGDIVILSPGCASFDMFRDFSDRGDQFRENVLSLGEMNKGAFIFRSYHFDAAAKTARFTYAFEKGGEFTEAIAFSSMHEQYDTAAFDRALQLSFFLIGTSYFKTFPTPAIRFEQAGIDEWQATFLNKVYQEGLSQFAFENELTREALAQFRATGKQSEAEVYGGSGTIALQSGGKDSLLTAVLLEATSTQYIPWYVSSSDASPLLLHDLSEPLVVARRSIARDALIKATTHGAKNGHVPVTYILQSIALLQAILLNKNEVLVSIAHEGEEPHAHVGDLSITHQWSKTWDAEQLFAEYVTRYISQDIHIGSPLRRFSELRVAELFVEYAWKEFGHRFSSCNRANYTQGADNSELKWCGECPKCANSYLLFAPFLASEALNSIFNGQGLFEKPLLQETFKGLLGVDGVMKPFECVGEIEELRFAYHLAMKRGGYAPVSFDVPEATFDYRAEYPSQVWAQLLQ